MLFLPNGFSELIAQLNARPLEGVVDARLQALWKRHGSERKTVRFYLYPNSDAHLKLWAAKGGGLEILISQGFLNLSTDESMKAAFTSLSELNIGKLKQENFRYALGRRLDRVKGSSSHFRYWFFSFFLYPLERLLKIAKME